MADDNYDDHRLHRDHRLGGSPRGLGQHGEISRKIDQFRATCTGRKTHFNFPFACAASKLTLWALKLVGRFCCLADPGCVVQCGKWAGAEFTANLLDDVHQSSACRCATGRAFCQANVFADFDEIPTMTGFEVINGMHHFMRQNVKALHVSLDQRTDADEVHAVFAD